MPIGIIEISVAPMKAKIILGIPKRRNVLKLILLQNIFILNVLLKRWKQATKNIAVFKSINIAATGTKSVELPKPANVAMIAAIKDASKKTMFSIILSGYGYPCPLPGYSYPPLKTWMLILVYCP